MPPSRPTRRTLSAQELLGTKTRIADLLQRGEVVTEIILSKQQPGTVACYDKHLTRKSIDFAILAIGSVYALKDGKTSDAKISLGAVAPVPMRATKAEQYLIGKQPTPEAAAAAQLTKDKPVMEAYTLQPTEYRKVN